jgi:site-specific DNA recombinase
MYSTGKYSFEMLRHEMGTWGLRTCKGKALSKNTLTAMLNNPFYYGVIFVRRSNERYTGLHEPLVTKTLFDRCQDVLHGRIRHKALTHAHAFRKRVRCNQCGLNLIGETQKGHVYYRCHRCKGVSVREESITAAIRTDLAAFQPLVELFGSRLKNTFEDELRTKRMNRSSREREVKLQIGAVDSRLDRLVDALVDESIDSDSYKTKRQALLDKKAILNTQLREIHEGEEQMPTEQCKYLELENALQTLSDSGKPRELLRLVDSTTSNLGVRGKEPYVAWVFPFNRLAEIANVPSGALEQDRNRIFNELCELFGVHTQPNIPKSPSPETHSTESEELV